MKVAYVVNYFRPEYGDLQSYRCRELGKLKNIDVTLFAGNRIPSNRRPPQKRRGGIKEYKLKELSTLPFKDILPFTGTLPPSLLSNLVGGDFDIINCDTIFQIKTLISLLGSKIADIPIVLTSDLPPSNRKMRTSKEIRRWVFEKTFFQYALNNSDAIISRYRKNLEYLKEIKRDIVNKMYLIPDGVDTKKFSPDKDLGNKVRNKFNISKDSFVILSVSSLTVNKGVWEILKIMPKIAKKIPNAKFVFIGDGPLKKYLFEYVKRKELEDFFIQRDYIPHKEIEGIFNMADVFIAPTHGETGPLSNVIIQSMSCSKPVVATDVCDASEYIESYKSGILIDIKDYNELFEGILKVYENPHLAERMGEKARKNIKPLDWGEVAKKTKKVYEKVLDVENK